MKKFLVCLLLVLFLLISVPVDAGKVYRVYAFLIESDKSHRGVWRIELLSYQKPILLLGVYQVTCQSGEIYWLPINQTLIVEGNQ